MTGSMLILTWVGIIFVIILHRAIARCKILTNIMPTTELPSLVLNFLFTYLFSIKFHTIYIINTFIIGSGTRAFDTEG